MDWRVMMLEKMLAALVRGEDIAASTSEMIAVALAAGQHDLLPRGYCDLKAAWERLDASEQGWVRGKLGRSPL